MSDFGLKDNHSGIAKGVLLHNNPNSIIVDVTHFANEANLLPTSFFLLSLVKYFPLGTIHVVANNIFYDSQINHLVVAEKDGHIFIAPDNGVLTLTFGEYNKNSWQVFEYKISHNLVNWMTAVAGVLNRITEGNEMGIVNVLKNSGWCSIELKPLKGLNQFNIREFEIECGVLFIDNYDNVILNIHRNSFESILGDKIFSIKIPRLGSIKQMSSNYCDVPAGEPLCMTNISGFLELAINHGSMATKLNLKDVASHHWQYNKIKIHF